MESKEENDMHNSRNEHGGRWNDEKWKTKNIVIWKTTLRMKELNRQIDV